MNDQIIINQDRLAQPLKDALDEGKITISDIEVAVNRTAEAAGALSAAFENLQQGFRNSLSDITSPVIQTQIRKHADNLKILATNYSKLEIGAEAVKMFYADRWNYGDSYRNSSQHTVIQVIFP